MYILVSHCSTSKYIMLYIHSSLYLFSVTRMNYLCTVFKDDRAQMSLSPGAFLNLFEENSYSLFLHFLNPLNTY